MKHLSFTLLILCICFPPIGYMGGVELTESLFEKRYYSEIESVYLTDSQALLNGDKSLRASVGEKIDTFLKRRSALMSGLSITVGVKTKSGTRIYPSYPDTESLSPIHSDPMVVASQNYRLLSEEPELNVAVNLDRNSLLSLLIFLTCIFLSLSFLYYRYSVALKKYIMENADKKEEVKRLLELEAENNQKLQGLLDEREALLKAAGALKTKVDQSAQAEDEMLDEIERLEKELESNLNSQEAQKDEIEALNEKIDSLQSGKKRRGRAGAKKEDAAARRFRVLYKKILINERAIGGFVKLEEDKRLKCEEVIHRLNNDPDSVTIKRKVFGSKGSKTFFEVIFSHKGRLYFRKNSDGKIEIMAVGTKNTQEKELQFLDSL